MLPDLAGVFLAPDFTGVFLVADLAGVFLELLAICLVLVPCLAPEGLEADLAGDLTGVETGAGVVTAILLATGVVGFDALLTGVEAFLLDCFEADLLLPDYVSDSLLLV